MIARVVRSVSSVCQHVLISIGDAPLPFEAAAVRYVRDEVPGAGPLAGIHAGLRTSTTPWLLVVACDMPFMTQNALEHLLAARDPSLLAVMAVDSTGRKQPLCACYHRDVLPLVESQLAHGQLALRDLIRRLDRVRTVRLPDGPLRNINTPADVPPSC